MTDRKPMLAVYMMSGLLLFGLLLERSATQQLP